MIQNAISMGGGEIRIARPTSVIARGTSVTLGVEKMPLAVLHITTLENPTNDGACIYAKNSSGTVVANKVTIFAQNMPGTVTSSSYNAGSLTLTTSSSMNSAFGSSATSDYVVIYG